MDISTILPWVYKAGSAVAILLVGWITIAIIVKITRKALIKSALDESVYVLVLRTIRIVLWIVVILTALSRLDMDMKPIITVLGTCGVAIALALKDSLGNVAGGLILVFTKPFVAGDEVEINGQTGVVDHIDIMTTQLHTYDNRIIILPNGNVTNSMIVNATRSEIRRVDSEFCVGYDSDIELVKEIIRSVAAEGPMLMSQPAPYIELKEHGDSALVFKVGIWCRTEDRFAAATYVEEQIKHRFDESGIMIPYPHMEVRVHEVNAK